MRQILPIVEGHGEVQALPILVGRLLKILGVADDVEVLDPIRADGKYDLLKAGGLERYARLAVGKAPTADLLVLIDADFDCAATLGPALQARLDGLPFLTRRAVVLAVQEYENWVIGDAAALAPDRSFSAAISTPPDPEGVADAKGWLRQQRGKGRAYSPTLHQGLVTGLINLEVVRQRCPSFDKFWREVERLVNS